MSMFNQMQIMMQEIKLMQEVLKSNLCGFNYVYILLRGDITIMGYPVIQVAFKNCALFTK